jgi:tetratricopeptide (TPR) repeat protein/O-antigen ligase
MKENVKSVSIKFGERVAPKQPITSNRSEPRRTDPPLHHLTSKPASSQSKNKLLGLFFGNRVASSESTQSTSRSLNWTIKICVHLAVFLLPLFFLPITASPIEFNKLALLVMLAGIAGVAWIGRMVSENELQLKKSFLSVPILVFMAAYTLSSIFSIYRENSLWGYLGGEGMSLMALLFFVLLFFVISNNFKTGKEVRALVLNFIFSSFLVFGTAFLHLLGANFFKFAQASGHGFNTIGSISALCAYAGALLVFSLALITEKVEGKLLRGMTYLLALISLLIITIINFKLIWLILTIAMAVLMMVGIMRNSKQKSAIFLLPTIIFVYCLFGFFIKKPIITIQDLPPEYSPSWNQTLKVSWQAVKEKPLFGVGPGNFNYVFGKYKAPMAEMSGIDFQQGVSFVGTLLGMSGLIVSASYLFLVFVMGRYAGTYVYAIFFGKKSEDNKKGETDRLITPLALFWLFLTVILFLINAPLTLLFAWWFIFAVLDALSSKGEVIKIKEERSSVSVLAARIGMKGREEKDSEEFSKISLVISLLFVGIITGFIAVVYVISQKYLASYYYQKALVKASQENPSLEDIGMELGRSIYYNQNRDLHYSALSDTLLLLAKKRINEKGKDLTDADREYIWGAVSQGIQAAGSAITINKGNYNNYVKLASIYHGIIGLVGGADQPALENYERARDLNPTNAFIYNQIASIYLARYDMEVIKAAKENNGVLKEVPQAAKDNLVRAEENLNKSLEVYPYNSTARLLLVTVFELKGDLKGAIKISEENLSLTQDNYNLALGLSLLYYKDKNYDAVINLAEAVVKRWENYSDARYVLGLALAQKNELGKAKEQFQKVLDNNQDNEDIKKIISELNAGKTNFLVGNDRGKVEEVQQKIEDNQKKEEQDSQTILNNKNQSNLDTNQETQPNSTPQDQAPVNPAP